MRLLNKLRAKHDERKQERLARWYAEPLPTGGGKEMTATDVAIILAGSGWLILFALWVFG